MKHIPDLKQQIEAVIGTTLDEYEITMLEWKQSVENLSGMEVNQPLVAQSKAHEEEYELMTGSATSSDITSLHTGERIFFRVGSDPQENTVVCWGCPSDSITMETRRLIELLLRSSASSTNGLKVSPQDDDADQQFITLGRWLQTQIEVYSSDNTEPLPAPFNTFNEFQKEKVIFLLQGETPDSQRVDSKVLNKLLESYFGEEVTLIPLGAQEWLFMSDETVVTGEADEDTAEARKDSLHAFCSGLYELVASEFAGVFHLSASLPCIPKNTLVQVASLLQESVHLGRSFHVTQHIHLPWELQLEQLVASIPEQQRHRFIQEIGKGTLLFNDSETLATLEIFFSLDCNVSETAKRLFIHRNTLVYRLDKIKQEIGYDVRHFKSANIVQLLLLMYKVTKKV
ncbi:helix-turn-helix domain-containing protein [Paenibacillus barcinonensis]|uniref:Helix-turn-helix domain-containing protein n=1 Tax=Paenibacillus barcinonensis TaxID=198119 RepID=A0A2V4WA32_PAEBA|nr:helix-turn-helix domain-containing protein [Paenibacillus barcinonensis]PYE44494.1 PucR-like helix-turn-helix protein [Paenibacillus barcinonensis]QKS57959.1 helix-turn-helix domain-containing protein [Paenibacillus barcinonensis]